VNHLHNGYHRRFHPLRRLRLDMALQIIHRLGLR
jgi:hypothetical protein